MRRVSVWIIPLLVCVGCHRYIPVLSDIEVAPIRALEFGEIEAKKAHRPPAKLPTIERQ